MTKSNGAPPSIEQWLEAHAQQGGSTTEAERQFIADMRKARAGGVGFGWMQQMCELEWAVMLFHEHGIEGGAHGMGDERAHRIDALEERLRMAKSRRQLRRAEIDHQSLGPREQRRSK